MKFQIIILPIFLILVLISRAQGQNSESDYDHLLKSLPADIKKIRILDSLAKVLSSPNPQLAKKFSWDLIHLAEKLQDRKSLALGYSRLGHASERISEYDSAFHNLFIGFNIYSEIIDNEGCAVVLKEIGNVHRRIGNYDSSASYIFKSLALAEKYKFMDVTAENYSSLGSLVRNEGKFEDAIKYFNKSILYYIDKKSELAGRTYENIGIAYTDLKNYKIANLYYSKAKEIFSALNETRGLARLNLNIAYMLIMQRQFDEALARTINALEFYEQINHLNGIAECYGTLASIHFENKNFPKSEYYAKQALNISKKIKNKETELESYQLLQNLSKQKNDYLNAYLYLQKATLIHDSLTSKKSESIIKELQAKYTVENDKRAIEILNLDNKLKDLSLKKQKLMRNSLIFLLVIACIIIILFKMRQKNLQVQKLQEERLRISRDLHDEVGSTLSSISMLSGFAGLKLADKKTSDAESLVNEISDSAIRMGEDMNDIIWALNRNYDYLESIINRLKNYISKIAQTRNINFQFNFESILLRENISMKSRKNIYLICKEALNNAVKHSNCKNITISFSKVKSELTISIKDDGTGFNINDRPDGNGLNNIKERAAQIGAALTIESRNDEGTEIRIFTRI